jgi:hypothetical protein
MNSTAHHRPGNAVPEPGENGIVVKKRGPKAKLVVEFPAPLWTDWIDPEAFHAALTLHMARHGDTAGHLHKAVVQAADRTDRKTIADWAAGRKVPRTVTSMMVLSRIERRYQLAEGYFKARLPHASRAATGHKKLPGIQPAERRRLAWHLPDDFDMRPLKERDQILEWVRTVVISGATDYRRFQAEAMKHRYAVRFPTLNAGVVSPALHTDEEGRFLDDVEFELGVSTMDAPPALAREVADLVRFKTATLTDIGLQRSGVWNENTALQKIEHLGLLFGALTASPDGPVAGRGVPATNLAMALLVFPAVWDWYVQWRERKRGFYTVWEVNMLQLGLALTRAGSGWLRQHPVLARRLRPIPDLLSSAEIDAALADWEGACDKFYQHGLARSKEIQRVARVHRDPFEPIMPILEADSPVGEYRRITEEILRLKPDARRYPRAAAEAVRSFLMLRLGLHLGVRQKNLRELLVCGRGDAPTPERQLEARKRGELRWSDRERGWEVLIPASAFKNANSSFFAGKPFRLLLPDLGGLYRYIEAYLTTHRAALLNGAPDPGCFFVKTAKVTSRDASYDQTTFYEAWRLTIQRYGIYNPYTKRGVIDGLLPHGPHNVRDVLATHILKQTGSYEQASYAIQDTPETVAKHYGRFLPQDKAALAAQILNHVWEAA